MSEVEKLTRMKGVKLPLNIPDREKTIDLIQESMVFAEKLAAANKVSRSVVQNLAVNSSLQTVSALFSSTNVLCSLSAPPEEIEPVIDSSGDIVLRCFHDPSHEWNLNGIRRP